MNAWESTLTRTVWMLALRGVLAILFGVVAFFWPGLFWFVVVFTFAGYALADGIMAIVMAVLGHARAGRWALLLEGIVGIAIAAVTIVWPDITELALLYLIAGWCCATGVLEIMAAFGLGQVMRGAWIFGLSGVLSLLLGLALALAPLAGLLVVAWWIGAYALASGVLLLILAVQAARLGHRTPSTPHAANFAGAP